MKSLSKILRNGLLGVCIIAGLMPSLISAATTKSTPFGERADVQAFIQKVSKQYDMQPEELTQLFNQVTLLPSVTKTMDKPYEAKPWYKYKQAYITQKRIDQGVKFWNQHQKTLEKAEKQYGVPASIIVAIVGVESNYGNFTGKYPILDTLSTFAFEYPRRSRFFKQELTQLLLIQKETGLDISNVKSSYAGAIGLPQFMPSSFREYAVDFDNDGNIDLWKSEDDVIGSVANYFSRHGWQTKQAVIQPATVTGTKYKSLKQNKNNPSLDSKQLALYNIKPNQPLLAQQKVNLIQLKGKQKTEFWLGFKNFYVIRRYNPSNNYAMAVYQLSVALDAKKNQ